MMVHPINCWSESENDENTKLNLSTYSEKGYFVYSEKSDKTETTRRIYSLGFDDNDNRDEEEKITEDDIVITLSSGKTIVALPI